jgi:two-component system, NtrC family, sensor histidine kinase HydH
MRERLEQAAQVAHLHELTEKILENVPTGVLALSADGRITSLNRVLREKLAEGALGGKLGAAFGAAPPAVVARLAALVEAALGKERVQSLHGEHLALFGKDGQYSVHAVPLEPRLPEARVLLVVEDLSEVRALESRLLRAEKLATVGVLAAGIAHEIGTPLGVVRGRAEYLLGKLTEASPHAGGMHTIIDQIDRVTRSIRELLDFARVKAPMARAAALAPVVRAVAELLRFEAERRDVTLTTEVSEELPLVSADPDQLQQVLVNLVMNALDACSKGGHVAIRASAAATARIEVEDDGCGIPDELRHQVFDPFFTTKKRGQGTGLGLSIAAQIVGGHGGEIELDSTVGKGTRVMVVWPLAHEVRGNAIAG